MLRAATKALFIQGEDKTGGDFKWLTSSRKQDRLPYVNLLAMTLIEPDELWWNWEQGNCTRRCRQLLRKRVFNQRLMRWQYRLRRFTPKSRTRRPTARMPPGSAAAHCPVSSMNHAGLVPRAPGIAA
ncbi:MAG: hypothetical protein LBQ81_07865 [Zoogloeaceae bacterium]|jgi:hypothetical protein|nr:hypothetical protein [Zoogloeaceae bacterium]